MKILAELHLDILNAASFIVRVGRVRPKTQIWEKIDTWAVREAFFGFQASHLSPGWS